MTSVSVVCGVMDREEHLLESLPTWLACPEVGEVVLVDWSSKKAILPPDDPRVVIVRVEGQRHWHPSKCHNLGLRLTTCPKILRLDADHQLKEDFFERHQLDRPNHFFCVDQPSVCDTDEIHLAGVVYAWRTELMVVGGYNERIATYGYEDNDLVERLKGLGSLASWVQIDTLHHIPHSDAARLCNQNVSHLEGPRPACFSWAWNLGVVHRSIAANREFAKKAPWSPGNGDRMAVFEVLHVARRFVVCQEVL